MVGGAVEEASGVKVAGSGSVVHLSPSRVWQCLALRRPCTRQALLSGIQSGNFQRLESTVNRAFIKKYLWLPCTNAPVRESLDAKSPG